MRTAIRTRLRPMVEADIPQVLDIERESFPSPWPQTAYKRELTNKIARYFVLAEVRDDEGAPPPAGSPGIWASVRRALGATEPVPTSEYLLGFVGVWLMVNEAHIVTIAVREEHRRMGVGERLLLAAIELATDLDQEAVTLEVRASNEGAQRMYEKYAFNRMGLRKRYYTDNNEDAVIMTTPDLFTAGYKKLVGELRARHQERHPDLWP
ncbi:MAG: ribosomal protein S18-alanine N-acetyltransferase [Chloroflexi bacterium]|nr:ribosomal protein S18-alanine N-acetyltransferase [Chloroflexota bacterium]